MAEQAVLSPLDQRIIQDSPNPISVDNTPSSQSTNPTNTETTVQASSPSSKEAEVIPKTGRSLRHPLRRSPPPTSGGEAKGPALRVKRSEFMSEPAGQLAVGPDGRLQEGVRPPEYADISEDIMDGFVGNAEFYVTQLIALQNEQTVPPITENGKVLTKYDVMKRQQAQSGIKYVDDEFMLEIFAHKQDGKLAAMSPDEIRNIIKKDPSLLMDLMEVEERMARDILAASGLRAELDHPGHRPDIGTLVQTIDVTDQGAVRSLVNRLGRFLTTSGDEDNRGGGGIPRGTSIALTAPPGAVAGATIGGIAGAAIPGGLGAIGGAALGAALGPVVASTVARLSDRGVVLHLVTDENAGLQSVRQSENIRSVKMLGIDFNDLEASKTIEARQIQALQIIYHRAAFLTALGVPPQNLDALGDQFLHVERQRPENSLYRRDLKIDSYYRDFLAERRSTVEGGPINIIGHGPESIEEQRDLLRRAQEKALADSFTSRLLEKNAQPENHIQRLEEAIKLRDHPDFKDSRAREATKEKERLGSDRTEIENDATTLTDYQSEIQSATAERQKLADTLSRLRRNGVALGDFDATINSLYETISGSVVGETMVPDENGRLIPIPPLADKSRLYQKHISDDTRDIAPQNKPTESDADYKERRAKEIKIIEDRYKDEDSRITSQRRVVESAIERLEAMRRSADSLTQQAQSSEKTRTALRLLADIEQAKVLIDSAGGLQADLDSTMTSINSNPSGWPAEENADNRHLVRLAFIADRTLNAMRADPSIYAFESEFETITVTAPAAQKISPEQLRALDIESLKELPAVASAGYSQAQIEAAKKWAMAQLDFTQRSIQEEIRTTQAAERIQKNQIDSIDTTGEQAKLKLVLDMYKDTPQIEARATQAIISNIGDHKLEDSTQIPAADAQRLGYTEAEVVSGLPRNVLEIIQILTDYQNSGDRNGKFQQIWTSLGQNPDERIERISTFLTNALGTKLAPHGLTPRTARIRSQVEIFSLRLANSTRENIILYNDFASDMDKVINEFLIWSKAI
jgi:hypothetical protein